MLVRFIGAVMLGGVHRSPGVVLDVDSDEARSLIARDLALAVEPVLTFDAAPADDGEPSVEVGEPEPSEAAPIRGRASSRNRTR